MVISRTELKEKFVLCFHKMELLLQKRMPDMYLVLMFSGMNLNYITDKVTSKGCDVDSFVNTLTSTGIMNASGSKATTDIAALIDEILKNTSGEQVSIFISDCIFSPGSVSNPEAYLENQKIAIRNAVKSYIDRTGFAGCTVYRFTGSPAKFRV